ncbi:MAG: hypothetical protein IPO51_03835 [Dehalococcoidia bacterium]|nr:hypothetical protein [Dehalococcoidia bacterium]
MRAALAAAIASFAAFTHVIERLRSSLPLLSFWFGEPSVTMNIMSGFAVPLAVLPAPVWMPPSVHV